MTAIVAQEADAGRAAASAAAATRDELLAIALNGVAAGDLNALDDVWTLCADDLYGLALWSSGVRADAEDAVQDTFVRLVRSAGRVARARRPRAYLLAMVRRAALDLMRRRRHESLEEATELLAASSSDPATAMDARRASQLAMRLPHKLRVALFLRHFAELSFADAAKVMGVPTFTAASRYRLALARLRAWMGVES